MNHSRVSKKDIQRLYTKIKQNAEKGRYQLNPDEELTQELIKGLAINEKRYGYWACPCRLASGKKEEDIDIICPCYYRDDDLAEYGTCYCALYVSQEVLRGNKEVGSIPERRLPREKRKKMRQKKSKGGDTMIPFSLPLWRCSVCGYLCARDNPPEVCPICGAERERFERFV
jgi:ferredoxin-thioredoxin reductase catalytic subunit